LKLESYAGLTGLRFDREFTAFENIMSFYLNAAERVKVAGKKVVAKGPLSPVEVIFAGGAVAYDIATCENLLQSIFVEHANLQHQAVEAGMSPELSPWNLIMLGSVLNDHNALNVDLYSSACGGFDDQFTKSLNGCGPTPGKKLQQKVYVKPYTSEI
jgi:hypothetical protein